MIRSDKQLVTFYCSNSLSVLLMCKAMPDEVVCLSTPSNFVAVGVWYRNFDQTSDRGVDGDFYATTGKLTNQGRLRIPEKRQRDTRKGEGYCHEPIWAGREQEIFNPRGWVATQGC